MDVITRAQARGLGLTRYFTGKPCKRGHVCERFVGNASCVECERLSTASHYLRNRDAQLERMSRNNRLRREAIRDAMQARYRTHPESFVRSHARRRAATQASDLDEFTVFVLAEAAKACRRRRAMTGIDWHVDHMVPLSRGGAHAWYNIQVIPAWLNRWKRNRLVLTQPGEWIRHLRDAHG